LIAKRSTQSKDLRLLLYDPGNEFAATGHQWTWEGANSMNEIVFEVTQDSDGGYIAQVIGDLG
jgi:hypothetical protein